MSDHPRIPGHPSDMPSSRSAQGHSGVGASQPPGNIPGASLPGSVPGKNNNVRNIIIGAVATVFASTTVYYLTQYLNNPKSGDNSNSYEVRKEATVNAWKRYVTVDNIYYKSIMLILDDTSITNHPLPFKKEVLKESGIFKTDAAKLVSDKKVDPALKTMVTRRLERQTEFEGFIAEYCDKVEAIKNSGADSASVIKQVYEAGQQFATNSYRMYGKGVTELEDITKTLTQTYGQVFDPKEIKVYADYTNKEEEPDEVEDTTEQPISEADKKHITGDWNDNGNRIQLKADGSATYSLNYGDKGSGTWTINNNRLRLEVTSSQTNRKNMWFYKLSDITPDSFTMTLDARPYDIYKFVRVKGK